MKMKRFVAPIFALMIASAAWAQTGPRGLDGKAQRPGGRRPQATTDETIQADPKVLNTALRDVAQALATLMGDAQVRRIVKERVGQKFDGDFDVLYRDLANQRTKSAQTFHQLLGNAAGRIQKRAGREAAALDLSTLASALPQLQISVPVGFTDWDVETTAPLVAYVPAGQDDNEMREIEAFDVSGRRILLDAQTEPDGPVVVIGLNERTDRNGYLRPEFVQLPARGIATEKLEDPAQDPDGDISYEPTSPSYSVAPAGACDARTHSYGDQELLHQIKINNDHEPWTKGSPEIYATYGFVDNVNFRGQFYMSSVDNEGQWYSINGPLFYWQSYYGNTFVMAVFEQDGTNYGTVTYNRNGFNYTLQIHDGDDSLGSALVSFFDPNCGYYSTGDSEFYLRNQAPSVCGEASCVAPQGTYISHFTGSGCTGTESYYLPYDGWAYQCRPWNGTGLCGTIHRTVTNRSYRYNGVCYDAWPSGNTLTDFVTVYR
jgi:DUF3103 family protein